MKQILCLALVAAMLLASGCSPATTPTGAESQPTQTSSTETTKSGQVASAEDMAGVENVVITMGALGSLLKNVSECVRIPARRVEVVDTTAAGDVFNGALCVALSEGRDLVSALEFATTASSISVTHMGAQSSIPTRSEVVALMQ